MIRIAHFSDLHYGTKEPGGSRPCFSAAIDRAIALGAEAAVISGDATDHGLDLHAPDANGWSRRCGDWPTIVRC